MGTAEIIPGISGGTVALILGIYKRLIIAISSIDQNIFKLLTQFEFKKVWHSIDGNFLLFLGLGMISSIYVLSNLILILIITLPIFFKSFLSSLLFCSLFIRPLKQEFGRELLNGLLISGTLCFLILILPSASLDTVSGIYIFISGFIAVSALVVPGISGSFILVLLGSYPFLIEAVSSIDIERILYFFTGALLGLFLSLIVVILTCMISFDLARKFQVYDYRTFFINLIGRGWILYEISYFIMALNAFAVIASPAGNFLIETIALQYPSLI